MFSILKKSKRSVAVVGLLLGLCLALCHFLLMTPYLDEKKKHRVSPIQLFKLDVTRTTTQLSSLKNNKKENSLDADLMKNLKTKSPKLLQTKENKTMNAQISNLIEAMNNISISRTILKQSNKTVSEKVMHELRKLAVGLNNKFKSWSGHGIDAYLQRDFIKTVGEQEVTNQTKHPNTRPDSCSACTTINFTYLINNERLCQKPLDLLVFIFSSPGNSFQRQAIRSTWGSLCGKQSKRVKCAFVLGNPRDGEIMSKIMDENKKNRDILQIDFDDAYVNLTYKTLSSLKWFSKYCLSTKYILKTDDDVFVNLELIPKILSSLPKENFLGGFCWGVSQPNRKSESKWYVPYHTFRGPSFPPMCSGTGYLVSNDAIQNILSISKNIPFFHLEDVYIALCSKRLGIKPVNIQGFNNEFVPFERCKYRNSVMTSHQVNAFQLQTFWTEAHQCLLNRTMLDHLYHPIPYPHVQ